MEGDPAADERQKRPPPPKTQEGAALEEQGAQIPASMSGDGNWLLFTDAAPSNSDIRRLFIAGDRVVEPLIQTPADEYIPCSSPDGRYFAFQSDETGRWDIHVMEVATKRRWVVSSEAAYYPVWTRDGSRIVFRISDEEVQSVEVEVGAGFTPAPARKAFTVDLSRHGSKYDVTADGRRMLTGSAGAPGEARGETRPRMTVVLNWFDELRRRGSRGN